MTARQQWSVVGIIVLVLGIGLTIAARSMKDDLYPVEQGSAAPNFSARVLGDTAHKTFNANYKGKVVILNVWATYCEPCKREIPHLNSLLAKYGADKLHIVGLNVGGEEDRPKIPAFIAATKVDYALAFPEDELSNMIFATQSEIPQTAIFDRQGRMVKKIVGFSPAIQRELDDAIEQAMQLQ